MMDNSIVFKVAEAILKLTISSDSVTVDAIAEKSVISRDLVLRIASMLLEEDLRSFEISVSEGRRLKVIMNAARHGIPLDSLARYLSWRDFESLSSSILSKLGFSVITNMKVKVKRRRTEIDVFAVKENDALVIDCKRWNAILSGKNLSSIVQKHIQRSSLLADYIESILESGSFHVRLFPIILTLYEPKRRIELGTAIVPVSMLLSFIKEFPEIKYQILSIRRSYGKPLDEFVKLYLA